MKLVGSLFQRVGAALWNDFAPEYFCVLAKSRDAQFAQGRGAEKSGWIVLGNWFL